MEFFFHEEKQDNGNATLAFLLTKLNQFININVINRDQRTCSIYYKGFHFDLARGIALQYFKIYYKIWEVFSFLI